MTRIVDLPPGLHRGITPAVYHSRDLGLVSKSALDLVHRSPAHYKAWIDGAEEEATPALKFGSAFHCALLEPERYAAEYAAQPDFGDCRTKANKTARDAWRAYHEDHIHIADEEADAIGNMVAAVHAHPLAGKMIRDGEAELTVRWTDPETGLSCKSRADYYVPRLRMVADVKSTLDASPNAFKRDITSYRYHVQDALYRAAFAAVDARIDHFVFIAVEKQAPYAVAVYTLDSEAISKGHVAARQAIERLAECVANNAWPGYPASIQELHLPPWAA